MEIKINQRIGDSKIFVFSKDTETGLYKYSRPICPVEADSIEMEMTGTIVERYKDYYGLGYEEVQPGGFAKKGEVYGLHELNGGNTLQAILANRILLSRSQGKLRFANVDEKLTLFEHKISETPFNYGICIQGPPDDDTEDFLLSEIYHNNKLISFQLPVVFSLNSLGLMTGGKYEWDIKEKPYMKPTFESEEGLIYGEAATNVLEKIIGKCNLRGSGAHSLHWGHKSLLGSAFASINGPYNYGPDLRNIITTGDVDDVRSSTKSYIDGFVEKRMNAESRLKEFQKAEKEAFSSIDMDLSSSRK